MMPYHYQQQQQHHNLPDNVYNHSFPQPYYDQSYWQTSGMGGFGNGQIMPVSSPPPPFYYPYSHNVPYGMDNNNYGQTYTPYRNRKRKYNKSKTPPSSRGNVKSTKSSSPTDRRLAHFMPNGWKQPTNQQQKNNDRRQTVKLPDNKNQQQKKSKKSPEKAHRDTLLRRQRRQKNRVAYRDQSNDLGRLSDNRFSILSNTDIDTDTDGRSDSEVANQTPTMNNNNNNNKQKSKQHQTKDNKMKNTTIEVLTNREHIGDNRNRLRQTKTRNTPESEIDDDFEESKENEQLPTKSKDKHKIKIYLQDFKIFAFLKDRLSKCRSLKIDLNNEICTYAKNTIETYDTWVYNHYEVQVWQRFYKLGKQKDHWAKEIVDITHTREAKENLVLCEKRIEKFTSACVDANNIIEQHMKKILNATVAQKIHDLMLDYIKEATQSLAKTSTNRVRRATLEKEEWDALKAFENVATEQQKTYATTFCKPVLKSYQKKNKKFEVISAHLTYDVIPKIIPKCDITIPIDKSSLSSEQTKAHKEAIVKLSRDFRLGATELYVRITKAESDFQKERFDELLRGFPADKAEVSQTQIAINNRSSANDAQIDDDDNEKETNVFTQKPSSSEKQQEEQNDRHGSQLYIEYVELALKRNLLEIEREVLFLAESSAVEAPSVIQVARDITPVLRKDFVLQA
ncbi:unnamed protein product [Adineta ricciae]|uniref:Uncharacterized protein n=1 Tax=Adineta ricciae TaxID=249248 RepID=A0A815WMA9_ADIRI|nr:unnamed protein product [Adineta ricciae]CAF1661143.1 unnamed protein product [Adineta ricciae]